MTDVKLTDAEVRALADVIERMKGDVPAVVEAIVADHVRRALQDAADAASVNFVFGAVQLKFADWLRDRAAAVGVTGDTGGNDE